MVLVVPNPQALGNQRQGRMAYRKGITSPEAVLRYHLGWNRGAAADYHFAVGYREEANGADVSDALSLTYSHFMSAGEKVRRLEIMCELNPGLQWALDEAKKKMESEHA